MFYNVYWLGKSCNGFRGVSHIMRLPYFDPSVAAVLDIGHMTDSLCRRFLRLFRLEAPEDGLKVREFEQRLGRIRHCWVVNVNY